MTDTAGRQAAQMTTGTGKFIEIQGTAEGEPFDQATLIGLIDLARAGIEELLAAQAALLAKLDDN